MSLRKSGWRILPILLLAAAWAGGADKKVEIGEVPAKVREAVKAKWPKANIVRAATEDIKGKPVYGVELSEGKGQAARHWFARFNPDGKFRESEERLKAADLPKTILQALQKKYPSVQQPDVDRITESEGKSAKVTYELKFAMQVDIDASGKIVNEKELDFDVEDVDDE